MSVTSPELNPNPNPEPSEVPQPVQDAEKAVVDRVPKDLQASAQQVEESFNEFVEEQTDAAKANVPLAEYQQAANEPAIEHAAEDLKGGNIAGVLTAAPGIVKEVKTGWKTTEFWLTLAGVVLTQLGTLHIPGKYGDTITTVGLLGSYALSRGLAKR